MKRQPMRPEPKPKRHEREFWPGEEFALVAAEVSEDPGSREEGGDLGIFPRGVNVPEIDNAAFSLEAGETSEIVQSGFGFHRGPCV